MEYIDDQNAAVGDTKKGSFEIDEISAAIVGALDGASTSERQQQAASAALEEPSVVWAEAMPDVLPPPNHPQPPFCRRINIIRGLVLATFVAVAVVVRTIFLSNSSNASSPSSALG
jgi:hypothetical protein